jgi:hypothetical protein
VNIQWHSLLIAGFIIGFSIWIVEQNYSDTTAMLLAFLILLGIMVAHPAFGSELQALLPFKA